MDPSLEIAEGPLSTEGVTQMDRIEMRRDLTDEGSEFYHSDSGWKLIRRGEQRRWWHLYNPDGICVMIDQYRVDIAERCNLSLVD